MCPSFALVLPVSVPTKTKDWRDSETDVPSVFSDQPNDLMRLEMAAVSDFSAERSAFISVNVT